MIRLNLLRLFRAFATSTALLIGPPSNAEQLDVDQIPELQGRSPKADLVSRLGGSQNLATYSAAEVHAESGLWNVYVVNNPPHEIVIRQSRPRSEIEFGLTEEHLWRNDLGAGGATALTTDWAWFIRNHEIVHLANRISNWKLLGCESMSKSIDNECAQIQNYEDEFGLPVQVHLKEDGLPTEIIMTAPLSYGGGIVTYNIHEWHDFKGQKKILRFDVETSSGKMSWIYRGFELIEDQDAFEITAPPGIGVKPNQQ